MDTYLMTDFEKVCRICMEINKTFLSINSFKIIDMIMACASVQIWENDDLPNQICHACFLQLQNTINFKQLCENSDKTFRRIIQRNNINLSNNQNDFNNVKNEELEDYINDNSSIDIKEEDFHENFKDENTLENEKIRIVEIDSKKFETNEDDHKKSEENVTYEDIQDEESILETFKCEKCNKEFKKIQALDQHMHQEHKATALKCNKCKIKCSHPLHLKEHKKLSHNPSNYICQRCDESFKGKRELKRHNKDEHSQIEKFVACHICDKSITKYALKSHLIIHEERDKIQCELCPKKFVQKRSLNIHIKQVHENQIPERKHLCNICGFASLKAAHLRNHFIKHSTERPHACDHCDKRYKNSGNLKEHISKVHLKNLRKFSCTFCSKTFFVKAQLVNHERQHTGGEVRVKKIPDRKHLCNTCGYASTRESDLRRHLLTHSSERSFACEHCDKNYKTADILKEHISNIHFNIRKYQCKFCSQAFHKRGRLVNHERRHTGEKPYECEVCDKKFIQDIALKNHMKTHTNFEII